MSQITPGPDRLLVLSPHLDDAALSCGGLLCTLGPQMQATVVTFFTHAHPAPITRAARSFLRGTGWPDDPEGLYAARREEDERALHGLGVHTEHAGLTDALFRHRRGWWRPQRWRNPILLALPELAHRYPTYRFDAARGRVSRGDHELFQRLTCQVRALTENLAPVAVLAPLGVGHHVDHLLVRDAAAALIGGPARPESARPERPAVGFYADLPYALHHCPDAGFVERHQLNPMPHPAGATAKVDLVARYATQAAAVYPDGIPTVPDEYWWPHGTDPDHLLQRIGPRDLHE
jgi:LmbE family N-acetylglucosaminyl deacetylase